MRPWEFQKDGTLIFEISPISLVVGDRSGLQSNPFATCSQADAAKEFKRLCQIHREDRWANCPTVGLPDSKGRIDKSLRELESHESIRDVLGQHGLPPLGSPRGLPPLGHFLNDQTHFQDVRIPNFMMKTALIFKMEQRNFKAN